MLVTLLATATAHPGFYRRTHTYLDKDQVMAYDPAAGSYSVLQMIRGAARRSSCLLSLPEDRKSVVQGQNA